MKPDDESAAQKAPGQKAADNTVNRSEDSYVKSAITNKADFLIREELDKADDLVDKVGKQSVYSSEVFFLFILICRD